MDRESIIREWFYRLPKGYAEPPYTKAKRTNKYGNFSAYFLHGSCSYEQ